MPDALGREHVSRLQTALPAMLEALACEGPGLLRLMANDHSLAARAQACAPAGAPWLARLQALAAQQAAPGAPGLQESALCEQTARVLGAIARCRPLLLLLDDLQWADTPSLDMLFYLGRHLEAKRILILGAYRPGEPGLHPLAAIANEFQRQWGDIRVDLAQVDARRFVDAYLDSWPNRFGAPFREALARHTASNALFTVELVQAMQQRGDLRRDATGRWIEGSSLAWEQLPPRVEGAIAQRIGQLTAAQQELLETASVEGEDFCAEVLARVRGLPEDAVIAALSGPLGRQAGLVAPHGLVPLGDRVLSRYRFHHALFQSYLYGRLDRATRAHLHGATADALEALYGEQAPQLAGQLARHYEEAGRADKAARYLLDAGRQAAQVGAHGEAIGCFERALGLLEDIPGAAPLTELEFLLQTALDSSLLARGWATAARLRASGRAYELGRATGQTGPAVLYALWRLGILYGARGNFARAIELAGELLAAARAAQDALHITAAHALFARCHLLQGEFVQARRHLDQAGPLHAEQGQPAPEGALLIWVNVEISAAFTQWALGYPDQAQHHIERALAYPGGPPDLFAIAYARSMAATFYAMRHQDHLAQQWAERVASANTGEELLELQSWSAQILGWVEARAGRKPQGIARIVEAMGTPQAQGTEALRYNWLAFLAEAYLANGEIRPARQIVEKALAELDDQTRYYQAELWRLRGEAALGTGAPSEAEVYFQQAIAIARRQEARAWELRATVSLARLWQAQGRREEGREMLAGIYGWFTEGFDTADLREAKALLDALHSARN